MRPLIHIGKFARLDVNLTDPLNLSFISVLSTSPRLAEWCMSSARVVTGDGYGRKRHGRVSGELGVDPGINKGAQINEIIMASMTTPKPHVRRPLRLL